MISNWKIDFHTYTWVASIIDLTNREIYGREQNRKYQNLGLLRSLACRMFSEAFWYCVSFFYKKKKNPPALLVFFLGFLNKLSVSVMDRASKVTPSLCCCFFLHGPWDSGLPPVGTQPSGTGSEARGAGAPSWQVCRYAAAPANWDSQKGALPQRPAVSRLRSRKFQGPTPTLSRARVRYYACKHLALK